MGTPSPEIASFIFMFTVITSSFKVSATSVRGFINAPPPTLNLYPISFTVPSGALTSYFRLPDITNTSFGATFLYCL
jgi:hypothetical protein